MNYLSDQSIKNKDFNTEPFLLGEYENCTFEQCNFSGLDMRGNSFENCSFKNCDLSNIKVPDVAFRQITFENCKLLGVHFHACNPFLLEFSFQNCQLDYSSFYNLKIKKSKFIHCRLTEVDFTQTELSGSDFQGSDGSGATFDQTVLENVDFRNTQNMVLDPEINRIKGARFELDGLPGLLGKYRIKIG